jgi:hypothetical protein
LPKSLQRSLNQKIIKYEEDKKMPLISPFEQMAEERGMEKGIEKGMQQTLQGNIISILQKRFGVIPNELVEKINKINDIQELQKLLLETISVNSLIDFENMLSI